MESMIGLDPYKNFVFGMIQASGSLDSVYKMDALENK